MSWVDSAVGEVKITSRQPCLTAKDFSVYQCDSNVTFNFANGGSTTGGIIGTVYPKVFTNAQNSTVFYNIGIHDSSSFFGDNTSSNNNDFASIVGTVNFPS